MGECIICRCGASVSRVHAGTIGVNCEVCGNYWCSSTYQELLARRAEAPAVAARLAAYVRDANLRSRQPRFCSDRAAHPDGVTTEDALEQLPDDPETQAFRAAGNLFLLQQDDVATVDLRHGYDHPLCFAADRRDMQNVVDYMQQAGYLRVCEHSDVRTVVSLTPEAWSAMNRALSSEEGVAGAGVSGG
jgi:hypothetical protein